MNEKYFTCEKAQYRWYDPNEIILGKKMKDHLKFAVSYWHTLCSEGADMFGRGVLDKSFGGKDPIDVYKHKVDALMELMNILSIDYFYW